MLTARNLMRRTAINERASTRIAGAHLFAKNVAAPITCRAHVGSGFAHADAHRADKWPRFFARGSKAFSGGKGGSCPWGNPSTRQSACNQAFRKGSGLP